MNRPTPSGPSDPPSDPGPTPPTPEVKGRERSTAGDRERSLLAALGDDLDLEDALRPSSKADEDEPQRRGVSSPYGRAAIPRQLPRTAHQQPEAEGPAMPGRERRSDHRPNDAGKGVKRRRPSTIREGRRSERTPRIRRSAMPPPRSTGMKSPGVTEPKSAGFFKERGFREGSAEVENDLEWDDLPASPVPSAEGGQAEMTPPATMPGEPRRTPASGLAERRAHAVRVAEVQRRRSESRATQSWILLAALAALCVGLGILFLALKDGPPSDAGGTRNESEAVSKP